MKAITPNTIRQITKNLREFGYHIEEHAVTLEVEKVKTGEQPKGIIGMFVKDMLTKNGYL